MKRIKVNPENPLVKYMAKEGISWRNLVRKTGIPHALLWRLYHYQRPSQLARLCFATHARLKATTHVNLFDWFEKNTAVIVTESDKELDLYN